MSAFDTSASIPILPRMEVVNRTSIPLPSKLSTPPLPNHSRACTNCARAKAKCIYDHDGKETCQRCARLMKHCETPSARVRATPKKRKMMGARASEKYHVEQLEAKVDSLVNLLKSKQDALSASKPPVDSHVSGLELRKNSVPSVVLLEPSLVQPNDQEPVHRNHPAHMFKFGMPEALGNQSFDGPSTESSSATPNAVSIASKEIDEMISSLKTDRIPCGRSSHSTPLAHRSRPDMLSDFGDSQLDELLAIFKVHICPWFPFIQISEMSSAKDLGRDQPFFLCSIVALTCRSLSRRHELRASLINALMDSIFVQGQRSIDLLLSALTYTAWCCYNFYNLPRLNGMVAGINVLLSDLALNRPAFKEPPSLFENAMRDLCGRTFAEQAPRTLEEQRIFLGCYYMNSVISWFYNRTDPLLHTIYLDQCCEELRKSPSVSDQYADALVRLQFIAEGIRKAPWGAKTTALGISCPIMMIVKPLQQQLLSFRAGLSRNLLENTDILMAYYSSEVSLYKVGLSQTIETTPSLQSLDRTELLHACHHSIKNFFDFFVAKSLEKYQGLTLINFLHLTRSLIILTMLTSIDHPDWDSRFSRQIIDVPGIIDDVANRFESTKNVAGIDADANEDDLWTLSAKKLRFFGAFYRSKMEEKNRNGANPAMTSSHQYPAYDFNFYDTSDLSVGDPTSLLDESWFRDVLGPWDFQG
ncbi:hypothetical protein BJ875DRAFT_50563 [Amylocarpus encephaloides]|uniref:Zn(2)-C6 fungal-type domain-containing protein n=1 Tax=Amylocarpus encephaloides TaxID=45428 RepID=A0A9P8C461_9HELO|nr:hypothetical protein BJ875DRAFT_50563 [Amylocarpus encephaloides]